MRAVYFVLLGAALFAGCRNPLAVVSARAVSLHEVGPLSFGVPIRVAGRVRIPVQHTDRLLMENSAQVPYGISTSVDGHTIDITIKVSLPAGDSRHAIDAIDLPDLPAGEYTIEYKDPDGSRHRLTTIAIPSP